VVLFFGALLHATDGLMPAVIPLTCNLQENFQRIRYGGGGGGMDSRGRNLAIVEGKCMHARKHQSVDRVRFGCGRMTKATISQATTQSCSWETRGKAAGWHASFLSCGSSSPSSSRPCPSRRAGGPWQCSRLPRRRP